MGPTQFLTIELLAIVIGSGTQGMPVIQLAQELLTKFGSLQAIANATIQELCQIRGLGSTKAAQELKAAFTLGLRAARPEGNSRKCLKTPHQAYLWLRDELEQAKREQFMVLLLDIKCCAITHEIVAIGTLSRALIHPREVFYPAVRHTASSLVLAHNHPSGDPTPSPEDIDITQILIRTER